MIEQVTLDFIEWINSLPAASIYLVFFLVAYIENIIPPIPGDLLVAFGGYLAAESVIRIFPVLTLTTIASVIGFMTMYWLGSHWGAKIEEQKNKFWLVKFIPLEYITKAQLWMQRWGMGVVLANRFLAGTRSVISLTAGISHTRISYTIICSTVSSVLWNGILLAFGWIVHENWYVIGDYLTVYGRVILAAIVLFLLVKLGMGYYNKNKPDAGE